MDALANRVAAWRSSENLSLNQSRLDFCEVKRHELMSYVAEVTLVRLTSCSRRINCESRGVFAIYLEICVSGTVI